MGKSNKSAKQELERIYGKGCFFARTHIAERIEAMGGIRTYKTFLLEKKYSRKKISHNMTYHHLKHKSEGGKATVENGANVEEIAHQYLHSLPRNQEEIINNMLREWKANFLIMDGKGEIETAVSLDFDPKEGEFIEIPLQDVTPEQQQTRKKKKDKKPPKEERLTRAQEKARLRKIMREYNDYER